MSKEELIIAFSKLEQSPAELHDNVEETKKYPDHDDPDYEGIRDIENLFDEISENYYKPIETISAFNDKYIEYESRGDKDKNLSPEQYLKTIRAYLREIINNHKPPLEGSLDNDLYGQWKIQVTMQINFASSLGTEESPKMYSKSNNIEILMASETNNIINELIESFLQKYQNGLKEKMKDTKFVCEIVDLLYYNFHKTTFQRAGSSYIKSYGWITNKRVTINPKNEDDSNCYQYAITVTLNHQNIRNHLEEI